MNGMVLDEKAKRVGTILAIVLLLAIYYQFYFVDKLDEMHQLQVSYETKKNYMASLGIGGGVPNTMPMSGTPVPGMMPMSGTPMPGTMPMSGAQTIPGISSIAGNTVLPNTSLTPSPAVLSPEMMEELKNLEQKVPQVRDVPGLFVDMNELLLANALETKEVTFGKSADHGKYSSYHVNFEVEGKNKDVTKYLEQLENFKRILSIEEVTINTKEVDSASLKLDLKFYYVKGQSAKKEPSDYDFMEGRYGTYKNLDEILKKAENLGR